MKVAIKEWTCSKHDYPQHCEECDHWRCRECKRSEWRTVGWRDASPWEEMLYEMTRTMAGPMNRPSVLLAGLQGRQVRVPPITTEKETE